MQRLIRIDPADAWAHREMRYVFVRTEILACPSRGGNRHQCDPEFRDLFRARFHRNSSGHEAEAKPNTHAVRSASTTNKRCASCFSCVDYADIRSSRNCELELARQVNYGDGLHYLADSRETSIRSSCFHATRRLGRGDPISARVVRLDSRVRQRNESIAPRFGGALCDKVSLLPGAWRDLADVHRDRNDLRLKSSARNARVRSIHGGPCR